LSIRERQEISAATLQRLKVFAFARNSHGEASSGLGKVGDIIWAL
jgi:hypothetical protein